MMKSITRETTSSSPTLKGKTKLSTLLLPLLLMMTNHNHLIEENNMMIMIIIIINHLKKIKIGIGVLN